MFVKVKPRKLLIILTPILIALLVVAYLVGLVYNQLLQSSSAASVTDNDTGLWYVNFKSNNLGFMTPGSYNNAIITKTSTGTATLATPGVPGFFYTVDITPTSSKSWKTVTLEGTWANPADVKVGVYDCTAGDPPADSMTDFSHAIPGFAGIQYPSGGIDISSIPNTVKCLQVKTYLGVAGTPPMITKISVKWDPLPVLLVTHSSDPVKSVGQNVCFQSKVSLSYTTDTNLVLWVRLPNNSTNPGSILYPGAYPNPGAASNASSVYSQNANRTCNDIAALDAGGICTSVAITGTGANGIPTGLTIPANSIYWKVSNPTPPTTAAGSTLVFNHCLKTVSGWQNNITYNTFANAQSERSYNVSSDANRLTPTVADPAVTVLTSSSSETVAKVASGTVNLHVNNDGGSAQYTSSIPYTLTYTSNGNETVFNPQFTDDLTDIFAKLSSPACGSVANPATRVSAISNGGTITGNILTWPIVPLFSPGTVLTRTLKIDYTGCQDDVTLKNCGGAGSDNALPVSACTTLTMGVDLTPPAPVSAPAGGGGGGGGGTSTPNTSPSISFAKGDILNGRAQLRAGRDDNLGVDIPYGSTYSYILGANATQSGVAIGNIVMIDKIPTVTVPANSASPDGVSFVGASIPSNMTGTILYHTGGVANSTTNPPDYNPSTGVFSAGAGQWTTIMPSPASSVTWIAFQLDCLSSPYFKPTSGICFDSITNKPRPVSTYVQIDVKLNAPSAACARYTVPNTANFYAFKASNSTNNDFASLANMPNLATPIKYVDANEPVSAVSNLPSFANSSSVFSIGGSTALLKPLDLATFTWNATNGGNDSSLNTVVTVDIPKVVVDGVDKYLEVVNTTQPGCSLGDPALQSTTHKVAYNCGTIQ